MKALLKQILTGRDNETVAWGRVMGAAVFLLFVIVGPLALAWALALKLIEPHVAFEFMDKLTIFVPAMSLSAAGLVAGTVFAEPKDSPTA